MAKVVVKACLKQWMPDNDGNSYTPDNLTQASITLNKFLPQHTIVLNAAMQGLLGWQKFFVCRVILFGIAVKAGAESSSSVLCNIVGDQAKADDLDLTNEQCFKDAAAQLTYNQLLQLVSNLEFMSESDVLVTFRRQFFEKRLELLVVQALSETSLQAPAAMTEKEKVDYYSKLVALAVDPRNLVGTVSAAAASSAREVDSGSSSAAASAAAASSSTSALSVVEERAQALQHEFMRKLSERLAGQMSGSDDSASSKSDGVAGAGALSSVGNDGDDDAKAPSVVSSEHSKSDGVAGISSDSDKDKGNDKLSVPQLEPADKTTFKILAIESMLQAVARSATPEAALRAIFIELYAHDVASGGKELDLKCAGQFADRCLAYLRGQRRAAAWSWGGELTDFFELLRGTLLAVPTALRSVMGAVWDPADMGGRAALDDKQRLEHIVSYLAGQAARLEQQYNAQVLRQLQLRNGLRRVHRTLQRCGKDAAGRALDKTLIGLHQRGVVRPEDVNAIRQQFGACSNKEAARSFIDSIIRNGWDFTMEHCIAQAIGFLPTSVEKPAVVFSLAGKAAEAAQQIRLSLTNKGVTPRVRVVSSPGLQHATQSNTNVTAGKLVESYDDAVIQVGTSKPGSSAGRVTLRANGAVVTQDPEMVEPMVQTLFVRHPGGGQFTPTTALMTRPPLLRRALTALVDMSDSKGAKWQISLSQQALSSLPTKLKQQCRQAGIVLKRGVLAQQIKPSAASSTPFANGMQQPSAASTASHSAAAG